MSIHELHLVKLGKEVAMLSRILPCRSPNVPNFILEIPARSQKLDIFLTSLRNSQLHIQFTIQLLFFRQPHSNHKISLSVRQLWYNNIERNNMTAIGALVFCTDCGNLLDANTGRKEFIECDVCGTQNKGS